MTRRRLMARRTDRGRALDALDAVNNALAGHEALPDLTSAEAERMEMTAKEIRGIVEQSRKRLIILISLDA